MTDTSRAVVRYLGGETGHRSFFGGTHSRTRVVMLALFIAAGIVLTPLVGWPGLAVGAVGCGITLAVTAKTHRGSVIERRRKSRRWRRRSRSGTLAFAPYSDEAWKDARDDLKAARRSHRRGRKAGIVRARRRLTSLPATYRHRQKPGSWCPGGCRCRGPLQGCRHQPPGSPMLSAGPVLWPDAMPSPATRPARLWKRIGRQAALRRATVATSIARTKAQLGQAGTRSRYIPGQDRFGTGRQ